MAVSIRPTRGNRAGFNGLVSSSALVPGQIYAILDEKWLALATGPAAFIEVGRGNIDVPDAAIVSAIRSGSGDDTYLSPEETWSAMAPAALSDASTIALNLASGIGSFTVTLGGNRTLGNPTNAKPGQKFNITVSRDGAQTLSFAGNYVPMGPMTLPASGKRFKVVGEVMSANTVHIMIIGEP